MEEKVRIFSRRVTTQTNKNVILVLAYDTYMYGRGKQLLFLNYLTYCFVLQRKNHDNPRSVMTLFEGEVPTDCINNVK